MRGSQGLWNQLAIIKSSIWDAVRALALKICHLHYHEFTYGNASYIFYTNTADKIWMNYHSVTILFLIVKHFGNKIFNTPEHGGFNLYRVFLPMIKIFWEQENDQQNGL